MDFVNILTTFINTNESRRKKLLNNIKNKNLSHININNCFDKSKLQNIFKQTKVLINIHQTEDHNTFEELRCLPALQNGVIIVSETPPVKHLIPYNDLIIWCNYDNIVDKTKDVLENYEYYHNKIFTKKNINTLTSMHDVN